MQRSPWRLRLFTWMAALLLSSLGGTARAGDQELRALPDTRELEAARDRKTLFGQPLAKGSEYGLAWFPETLRAPEMDLEYSELRLDWFHAEKSGRRVDEVKAETERSFGSLTLEVELPYLRDQESRHRDEGFSRIEIGARAPLFQFVSAD